MSTNFDAKARLRTPQTHTIGGDSPKQSLSHGINTKNMPGLGYDSTITKDMAEKFCFITVGATASFDALIRAVFEPTFLQALRDLGYTNLLVQFGKDGKELFRTLAEAAGRSGTYGLKIQGFDFTSKMRETMRIAKGELGRKDGVVLCHAGKSDLALIIQSHTKSRM